MSQRFSEDSVNRRNRHLTPSVLGANTNGMVCQTISHPMIRISARDLGGIDAVSTVPAQACHHSLRYLRESTGQNHFRSASASAVSLSGFHQVVREMPDEGLVMGSLGSPRFWGALVMVAVLVIVSAAPLFTVLT